MGNILQYLLGFVCLISFNLLAAQNTAESDPGDTLVIGVKDSPPFIFRNADGRLDGLSLQLWLLIAKELDQPYRIEEMNLQELLDRLEAGTIDLSINPLTVSSSRIKEMDFSQPFFATQSAVAVKASQEPGWLKTVRKFFSMRFLRVVLLLFGVILVFGFLVWLFEQHGNPEEFEKGWRGVLSGIWWSAVTMTTVGYGDKSPRTTGGRIIALIWMFTAIIIISGFTASITSSLTVDQLSSQINNLNDLRKLKLGSLEASSSDRYLKASFFKVYHTGTLEAGMERVREGKLDGFVYDEPILQYALDNEGFNDLSLLPLRFNTQYYSFATHRNSNLMDRINPILLEQTEKASWNTILAQYGLLNQ